MRTLDLLLRGGHVVRPYGPVLRADVGIADGRIAVIAEPGTELSADEMLDITGMHVLPGRVEPHAHIGLGGGLEEHEKDSAAAALGGTTTIYWMLIDSGSYLPILSEHAAAAERTSMTDFAFNLILMTQQHLEELGAYRHEWGIRAYKYYMSFRGSEGAYLGVEGTDDGVFFDILRGVRQVGGVLAVHPENIEVVWRLRERLQAEGRSDLRAWNESRPPFTEAESVGRAAFLGAETGTDLYFVHMSSRHALDELRAARERFPNSALHAETCPHYLTHTDRSEVGVLGKVNPPLREEDDTAAVWEALLDGSIQTVGSDHVGRTRDRKRGDIWSASAGFPGLPTVLPVLLSEGHHRRGLSLPRIASLTSLEPARIFGIDDRKGDIRVGHDADLAVVDLNWERTPEADWLGTWSDYSLYEDRPLRGWPRLTLIGGRVVQQDGEITADPAGRYLRQDGTDRPEDPR